MAGMARRPDSRTPSPNLRPRLVATLTALSMAVAAPAQDEAVQDTANPFFQPSSLQFLAPEFDRITDTHYLQAFEKAIVDAQQRLDVVAEALRTGDEDFLAGWIAAAAASRSEALAQAHRTAPADLHELIASVPDRPGALSSIAQTLSAAGINIEEFSLSHISPERGGEIRIIVAGETNAHRAVELLRADGCLAAHAPVIEGIGGAE